MLDDEYVGMAIRNENEVHGEDYCIQRCDDRYEPEAGDSKILHHVSNDLPDYG
jgi:hypothetical protein